MAGPRVSFILSNLYISPTEAASKCAKVCLFLSIEHIISYSELLFIHNVLGCIHYGSKNEKHKIAYEK